MLSLILGVIMLNNVYAIEIGEDFYVPDYEVDEEAYAQLYADAGIQVPENAEFINTVMVSNGGDAIPVVKMVVVEDDIISEYTYVAGEKDNNNYSAVAITDRFMQNEEIGLCATSQAQRGDFIISASYQVYTDYSNYYYRPQKCTLKYVGSGSKGRGFSLGGEKVLK